MTATITGGSAPITPTAVTGYEAERAAGSIVHPILGAADPDVTLRPAQARSGRLTLGFAPAAGETDSAAALSVLAEAALFTLTYPERGSIAMTFTTTGRISRELDNRAGTWTVAVEFQEVTP